jgi:hypothetical protein
MVAACTSSVTTPSASATPASTASATTTGPAATAPATASPTARIAVGDGALTSSSGTYLFFQLPNDPRFRAISFDAAASGIVPLQVAASATWSQSPGTPFVSGTTAYQREGLTLGTVPWPANEFTWSSDGRILCAVTPERAVNGAPLRLETAAIGQPKRLVTSGFGTYGDNATQRVLACDEARDRAIVATFGQGVAPSQLWVFRLSNDSLVRSVDYRQTGTVTWVAASIDGTLIAESESVTKSTIRATDDGAAQATLNGFVVQGFSGDDVFAVVSERGGAAVVEWKTARRVWSASGTYGGYLPEPTGPHLVVGIGFVGGSEQRDVYLVQPNGSAVLLPAGVRVGLRY